MYTSKRFRIGCGAFISVESEASGDHHQSESDRSRVRAARFGRNSFGKSGFCTRHTSGSDYQGCFGGDPILIQIGFTRFALRKAEAEKIEIQIEEGYPHGDALRIALVGNLTVVKPLFLTI